MKTAPASFIVVLLVTQLVCSAQSPPDSPERPLWGQMQEAVLTNQDLNEIRRILEAGFDIDSPIGCGTFNAVDGAVSVQNTEILKFLLGAGAQPKGSALLSSVMSGDRDVSLPMVEALLKAGADPNYKDYYMDDRTRFSMPLHFACYRGHISVVQLLLSQPGIELNTLDIDHRTPLMWAVQKGHVEVIRLLLEKGVDPKARNSGGKTASDIARDEIRKREGILQMITIAKADTEPIDPRTGLRPVANHIAR